MSNRKKPRRRPRFDIFGKASIEELPREDKVPVREVPAKVDGVIVGTAYLYEDGTVSIKLDETMPEEAKEKLRSIIRNNLADYAVVVD